MDANHSRALRSSFLVVENHLHYIRNQLESSEKSSASYRTRDAVTPEIKTRLLANIETMLDEIQQTMREFKLKPRAESTKRNIHGSLMEIWAVLEESTPEKMGVYGDMSKNDADLLTPHILRLQETLDDIYKLME